MTRAAKPLWGVTSSVAAIVYSIRVASRSSRQAQAFSCLTRAKHALAYIVNFEVATTSPFILREETSSAYASRLQVYSKIQDCMNVLLNMRAYSEFRCPLIFLRIVLYFQSDP